MDSIMLTNPQDDLEVVRLSGEASMLLERAEALTVTDDASMVIATDDLATIATLKRAIEKLRTSYTGPLNAHLKEVNDLFKGVAGPIADADKIVRNKVLAYHEAVNDRKREIERLNAEKLKLAQDEMRLHGELSQPIDLIPVTDESPKIVTTAGGEVTTKTNWKWRVIDIRLVPAEYLIVDETKVGKVVRAGCREIPGIEVYPENILSVKPSRDPIMEAIRAKQAELDRPLEELPDF